MLKFEHKPNKRLDKFSVSPVGDKLAWAKVRNYMQDADEKIEYVGHDGDYHYFQKTGVTSGLHRIPKD